jgi:hypothetical protein
VLVDRLLVASRVEGGTKKDAHASQDLRHKMAPASSLGRTIDLGLGQVPCSTVRGVKCKLHRMVIEAWGCR